MKLIDVLNGIDYEIVNGSTDTEIISIDYDSRKISRGGLYIAIRWTHVDGHKFVKDAVARRASAVVIDRDLNENFNGITIVKVKNSYESLYGLASNFYGRPADKLNIIGITGTNGKTTTTYLLKSIFEERKRVAVIGTIKYIIADEEKEAPNTTPDALVLNRIFSEVAEKGIKTVIMEISSHSIALGRVNGIKFNTVAFTNLSREHLDFHKDMETYFDVKSKLFTVYPSTNKIVNIDDTYGRRLFESLKGDIRSYGLNKEADFYAKEIKITKNGIEFILVLKGDEITIKSKMLGEYNVYNIVLASSIAYLNGFTPDEIKSGVEKVAFVEGRTELIKGEESGIDAIVDYAHTPDALERLLMFAHENRFWNRIILVFGCGGDRDTEKRPRMGTIACKYADYVILTNDNPRSESPDKIISDIEVGIDCDHIVETDRSKAIEKAVGTAKAGDLVVVAGKGHENYQITGNVKRHFSDREELLKRLV
ncbi:MAG: UDP-N-acetylmuramoyl-L-alanyl-D-glutamate--2,6-diaminopimelate ligase [Proteobacteria bacterium]|nr:UDP-N-acetylmuramoyl-L-alanyl-D-glutamate--2,6-diaminopimelate ligase [Pseudomonadota bacterium]